MILKLQAGETIVKLNGTLTAPMQLKGIDLQFDMKGPNPEQLSQIVGLPMPNLPPYHLKGDFSHREDEGIWQIKDFPLLFLLLSVVLPKLFLLHSYQERGR